MELKKEIMMATLKIDYPIPEEDALVEEFKKNATTLSSGNVLVGGSLAMKKGFLWRLLGNTFNNTWYGVAPLEKGGTVRIETSDRESMIAVLAIFEAAKAVKSEDKERAIVAALEAELQKRKAPSEPAPQ
jgi:hypothetical protein